jgi:ceramide glucosyltransferase
VSFVRTVLLMVATGSLIYLTGALLALRAWGRRRLPEPAALPPVTVLKPLCGSEPQLYENLRSFCDQDYPEFQVVFGLQRPDDPALQVARRVLAEFPGRDIRVRVDERLIGSNHKVSNLANMLREAAHPYLVIADSDIHAGQDYLRAVASPLADEQVGVVTCLYRGRSAGSGWIPRLGALQINEWFLPSVLVAHALGSTAFGFGATLALRRSTLDAIGGFEALASHLADDYLLAELARRRGLKTVLSPYLVDTLAHETSLSSLLSRELRWSRTIRTVQPLGHAFSFLTYGLPVTVLAAASAAPLAWPWLLPAAALGLRYAIHGTARAALGLGRDGSLWLVPFRDFLSFGQWCASYVSRRVVWRSRDLSVQPDGRMG